MYKCKFLWSLETKFSQIISGQISVNTKPCGVDLKSIGAFNEQENWSGRGHTGVVCATLVLHCTLHNTGFMQWVERKRNWLPRTATKRRVDKKGRVQKLLVQPLLWIAPQHKGRMQGCLSHFNIRHLWMLNTPKWQTHDQGSFTTVKRE